MGNCIKFEVVVDFGTVVPLLVVTLYRPTPKVVEIFATYHYYKGHLYNVATVSW